ncbi:N-acetylglucosamine-6-phosphate deacetylase [Vibrio sp.]|uniref:N-acetylglucosamine-6-phosphate deacetylase n=1 Tax=Vibrio sp. TaxID=678 RepID=UPI003D11309C
MTLQAITAQRIFDGDSYHTEAALVWREDKIVDILPLAELPPGIDIVDFGSATVVPGFIDIQVNGGGDIMFNQQTDAKGIDTICRAHRQHGTAYLLPTLISDKREKITAALMAAQAALDEGVPGIAGVHLEGPWLNPEKKGAHDPSHFYDPSVAELAELPWLTQGTTLVTLAPEKVNLEAIEWLSHHGVIVSCGHSNARAEELSMEKLRCINGFTHLFNAMSPLEGREPGVVGTALMTDHAWCSIITDSIHVAGQNVLMAQRVKPQGKLLIVTDAMASIGSRTNRFILNGEVISVVDNKLVNANGSLAGAHIGMDQSVAQVIEWGIDEAEAFRMASSYPAAAINRSDLGQLRPGLRASATILNDQYQTQAVLVDGELFHGHQS